MAKLGFCFGRGMEIISGIGRGVGLPKRRLGLGRGVCALTVFFTREGRWERG